MNNADKNRARTSALRKKNAKDFDEKILAFAEKNPWIEKLISDKKNGWTIDEVTDMETGETFSGMSNEKFLEVLKKMKSNKTNENEKNNSITVNLISDATKTKKNSARDRKREIFRKKWGG